MAEKQTTKRRGGGGKLARSEQVSIRLDPKLRFAAELAASKERRTLSSFIEWAVERAVKEVEITKDATGQLITALNVSEKIWDDSEPDRFANLALRFPDLLTHQERALWNVIKSRHSLWLNGPLDYSLLRCLWGEIVIEAQTGQKTQSADSLEEVFAPMNDQERQLIMRVLFSAMDKIRHRTGTTHEELVEKHNALREMLKLPPEDQHQPSPKDGEDHGA